MSGDTTDRPWLGLVPYLSLRQPVTFGTWWLGPVEMYEGPWLSGRFERLARKLIAAHLDASGQPLPNVALLAERERGVGHVEPTRSLFDSLQDALNLAVLTQNDAWSPDSQGWHTATTDNAELAFWPIDLTEGRIALNRGLLVRSLEGGHQIERGVTIRAPLELHLPTILIDDEVLDASFELFGRTPPSPASARLRTAARWPLRRPLRNHAQPRRIQRARA